PGELITLDEMERRYVRQVLAAVGGNKTHAARILGIDRRSLYRRLEEPKADNKDRPAGERDARPSTAPPVAHASSPGSGPSEMIPPSAPISNGSNGSNGTSAAGEIEPS
nr:hypothetical protein [Deltaproteobacteria bacterium]